METKQGRLSLDVALQPAKRSTSEQLNIVAGRMPSAPTNPSIILRNRDPKSPRRMANSMGIAELRRRRRSQLENSGSIVPLPLRIIQQEQTAQSLLSPRQVMCVGNYDLGRTIGRGQFGKVKIATHVLTREKVAVKIIRKKKLKGDSMSLVRKEIEILKSVNHPNIIKLYEVLETDRVVFLILELASGGEALDFVVTHGTLSEDRARLFFRQIVSALSYCHDRFITHRDLKAENLLLDEDLGIKLIDFGLSATFKPGEMLTVPCGSPTYAAPELMLKQPYYGPEIDIWSLGVVLYVFVCGVLPFKGPALKELYEKVTTGDYEIPDNLTNDCKDLLRAMLCVDHEARVTMEGIKTHPWVVHTDNWVCPEVPVTEPVVEDSIDETLLDQMEMFGFDRNSVLESVKQSSYNPASATFNLLRLRRDREKEAGKLILQTKPRRTNTGTDNSVYLSGFVSMPTSAAVSPNSSPASISPRISPTFTAVPTPGNLISPVPSRPTLSRVQSQKMEHRRQRSFTSENNIVPPKFSVLSPKRKRSNSDKDSNTEDDEDDAENQIVLSLSVPKKPAGGSRLRFQLSPRDQTKEEEKETEESPPNGEKVEEQKDTEASGLIRESKPKPTLRKTYSEESLKDSIITPQAKKQSPITKPVWSETHSSSEVKVREGYSNPRNHKYVQKRNSEITKTKRIRKGTGTWTPDHVQNFSDEKGKLSSRVFSITKQIISKRTAGKPTEAEDEPRALRAPFSATSTKNPKNILAEIQTYFSIIGIPYESVGTFALKGLVIESKVRFEIEVCSIPNLPNLYSVRMQRIDGDWETYKEFCNELFSKLNLT